MVGGFWVKYVISTKLSKLQPLAFWQLATAAFPRLSTRVSLYPPPTPDFPSPSIHPASEGVRIVSPLDFFKVPPHEIYSSPNLLRDNASYMANQLPFIPPGFQTAGPAGQQQMAEQGINLTVEHHYCESAGTRTIISFLRSTSRHAPKATSNNGHLESEMAY